MKNSSNKFLIYGFFFILFLFLILYPVNFILINKEIITNNFTNTYNLKEETNLDNKIYNIKNKIETMTNNYFPFANEINMYYRGFKNSTNQKLYTLTGHDFTYLGTNSSSEYLYQNNKDNYYILQNYKPNFELDERLDKMISFYNKIGKYQDTTIFLPNRYEFQGLLDNNIYEMSDYVTKFKKQINSNINVLELNLGDTEYQEYFYHTDHHWNSYGARLGYEMIMPYLDKTPLDLEVKTITDIEYHGSVAKSAGNPNNYDYLTYLDTKNLKSPEELVINKEDLDEYFKPLKITKRNNLFFDYYVSFYDGMYPYVYYNNIDGEDNLLIIGDSYSWQLDYILAQSFKKTITLNPRYIEKIDYKNFLEEEEIDKVLILMETPTTLFDQYDYEIAEKLGGK